MPFWFSLAIFLGSALLFLVEPMCGKRLLPLLGGTPAVWNTCMVFFQAGLLLGYAYAHLAPTRLGLRRHAVLHLALLGLAACTLPVRFPDTVPNGWPPVMWLLLALAWGVGLPFVLLSATTPLLQRWYAARGGGDPYFLYAASNLGSFAGLLGYPFLVEPLLSLSQQRWWWLGGYLILVALVAPCLPRRRGPAAATATTAATPEVEAPAPTWPRRLRWVVLALIPSSLMLSVTTYLTTDIAPVPLLWVVPLALYLLTFVLAFAQRRLVPTALVRRWVPLAVLLAAVVRLMEANEPILVVLTLHLLVLFWIALACHGELASDRPAASRLTEFYLLLAIGGALGGVVNSLIAPLVFTRLTEYPLMLVLAALVCGSPSFIWPRLGDLAWAAVLGLFTVAAIFVTRGPLEQMEAASQLGAVVFVLPLILAYLGHARPWRFSLSLAAILLASALHPGVFGTPVYRERSYLGVHLVADRGAMRRLVHGGTVHGMESLHAKCGMPLTYYYPTGPIGKVMTALAEDDRVARVGLVGLGAGSLAYYSRPGQHWTFFEIDPSVIHIARDLKLFTFLPEARGKVDVVTGDGRLQLEASPDTFGLLVLDAFGSDAIPLHLLTREALQVYLARLRPRGLLAFHISNNYLDLEPVLANLARDAATPLAGVVFADDVLSDADRASGKFASVWVVLARQPTDLPASLRAPPWQPLRQRSDLPVWTDDYSNVWRVFRWRRADD